MEIVVGKLAGFCFGVNHAVEEANKLLDNETGIYCLGEIVHNKQVVEKLENKGMKTVNSLDEIPDGSTVIFRAHGEAEVVYKKAEEKNLKVIDLTCGKVKAIHIKVQSKKEKKIINKRIKKYKYKLEFVKELVEKTYNILLVFIK